MLMEYLSVQVSENKHFFRYIYRPYPDSKQKVIFFRYIHRPFPGSKQSNSSGLLIDHIHVRRNLMEEFSTYFIITFTCWKHLLFRLCDWTEKIFRTVLLFNMIRQQRKWLSRLFSSMNAFRVVKISGFQEEMESKGCCNGFEKRRGCVKCGRSLV